MYALNTCCRTHGRKDSTRARRLQGLQGFNHLHAKIDSDYFSHLLNIYEHDKIHAQLSFALNRLTIAGPDHIFIVPISQVPFNNDEVPTPR